MRSTACQPFMHTSKGKVQNIMKNFGRHTNLRYELGKTQLFGRPHNALAQQSTKDLCRRKWNKENNNKMKCDAGLRTYLKCAFLRNLKYMSAFME